MNKREVEFQSENPAEIIRADLYTPEGEGPWPVAVMGGGWCYVKELAMPEYAKFIVAQGVAALIFDFRCLGASDGEPRQHLDPWMQSVTWMYSRVSSMPNASASGGYPTPAAMRSSSAPSIPG